MEQKNISLSYGIHRSPSLGNDGELSELVNLIPQKGELVNLQPPKETGITLADNEKLIYIHATSSYKNYILLSEDEDKNLSLRYTTEANPSETKPIYTLPQDTDIKQLQSIGNTLILITNKGIDYVLFKEGTYKYIGNKIPDIELSFSLESKNKIHYTGKDVNLYGEDLMYIGEILIGSAHGLEIRDELLSLLNPLLKQNRQDGLFYAPFFARYAYKTSLGDYTYISPPVLMVPNSGVFPFAEAIGGISFDAILGDMTTKDTGWEIGIKPGTSKIKKAINIAFHFNSCQLLANPANKEALSSLSSDWADIISSVDIFITPPQSRLNPDGTGNLHVSVHGEDYYYYKPRGGYMDIGESIHGYSGEYDMSNADWIILPQHDDKEYKEKMEQQGVFRLIKSFNLDELKTENAEPGTVTQDGFIRISPGTLENLDNRQALDTTYDYNSRDKLVPGYSFIYNQRLNIANLKRFPYVPSPDISFTYTNGYLGADGTPVEDTYQYSIYAFMSDNGSILRVNGNDSSLRNTLSWIFIPSSTAYKVVVQRTKDGVSQYAELPLKNHTLLNGAYYIGDESSFEFTDIEYKDEKPSILDREYQDYVMEPNKIYTSEVGNPFVFPLSGINTVGLGEILGITSATKALSQGQFGQFPLYAFSTDGIWALTVGDTGIYTSTHPVSRDVCTNPKSITPIDAAIVFATDQGLKLLQGSEVVLLSGNMEGENTDESIFNVKPEFSHLFLADTEPFTQMMATCAIAYDYSHNLLHLFPEGDSTKHYVYSLESGEYASYVGYALKAYVPGYPQGTIQIGNKLCTFEKYHSPQSRQGLAVTRQLAFDDPFAMKVIHDLRTLCRRTSADARMRVALFVSNDGYWWAQLRSLRMHSFKFYRFVLFSTMTDTDAVSGVTFRFDYRRTNKLR